MAPVEQMASLLASILRDEVPGVGLLSRPEAQASFLSAAADHGVDGLVRRNLKQRGSWANMPPAVTTAIDDRAREETVLETLRRREMTKVLAGLQTADVTALVLKGAALAYTHYPAPYLRPCADADVLVSRADRARAVARLGELGYVRVNSVSREAVHAQSTFERRSGSARHVVDFHWAISNRQLFAETLSFDELVQHAVPVRPLGHGVLTPAPVHALLLACIHRIAHHDDSRRLIWLYDIKLLAERLSPQEWDLFLALATQKQLAAVCHQGLTLTALLGCPAASLPRVRELGATSRALAEPSAAYIGGAGGDLRLLTLDLLAARGPCAKFRLVAGHVFPDAAYMRNAYGVTNPLALANAYVRRAALGLWRMTAEFIERVLLGRPDGSWEV